MKLIEMKTTASGFSLSTVIRQTKQWALWTKSTKQTSPYISHRINIPQNGKMKVKGTFCIRIASERAQKNICGMNKKLLPLYE